MPSYNQAEFIPAAVQSVLDQSYRNLELVVQDGASTDETVSRLDEIAAIDPRLNWSSEPDSGPADALNKACRKVRGEIVGWLNSDDLYASDMIQKVVSAFDENPDWIMCYGHADHIDGFSQRIGPYPTRKPDVGISGFSAGCFICQPSVFFKTSLWWSVGEFDTSLQTAFDFDYWIRAFKAYPDRIGFIDETLAKSRIHANCLTARLRKTVAAEAMRLMHTYFGQAPLHWASTYLEELLERLNADRDSFCREANEFVKEIAHYFDDASVNQIRNSINSLKTPLPQSRM